MEMSRYFLLKEFRRNEAIREAEIKKRRIFAEHPDLQELENRRYDAELSKNLSILYGRDPALKEAEIREIDAAWRRALKKHSLREADFDPVFGCPKCGDTGLLDGKICLCVRSMLAEDLRARYELCEMLRSQNFGTFDLDHFSKEKNLNLSGKRLSQYEIMKLNLDRAKQFVEQFPGADSLLFIGGTGLGKTFLSNCIADALLNEGFSVAYHRHVGLEMLLSDMMSFNRSEESAEKYEMLKEVDLLIIDDLTAPRFDGLATALFDLIDDRQANRKSCIISTNMSSREIAEHLGERFHSRLHLYKTFMFLGQDTRTRRAE